MSRTMSKLMTDQIITKAKNLLEVIFPSPALFSSGYGMVVGCLQIRQNRNSQSLLNNLDLYVACSHHPSNFLWVKHIFMVKLTLKEISVMQSALWIQSSPRQLTFMNCWVLGKKSFLYRINAQNELVGRGPVKLSGAVHSRSRDRAAISYQYDVGNDFFAKWLGKRMMYSCAYFKTGQEDLDTAQEQKLDHICRKLHLKPGERLLDIGCGWGGLSMFAAENYGAQVVGISLSEKQIEYAKNLASNQGLQNRVDFKLQDYRDVGSESFDKIVSIGMVEHVGRIKLPEYFAHAFRMLKPGGLFLNHGISSRPQVRYTISSSSANSNHPALITKDTSIFQNWVNQNVLGTNSFMQH